MNISLSIFWTNTKYLSKLCQFAPKRLVAGITVVRRLVQSPWLVGIKMSITAQIFTRVKCWNGLLIWLIKKFTVEKTAVRVKSPYHVRGSHRVRRMVYYLHVVLKQRKSWCRPVSSCTDLLFQSLVRVSISPNLKLLSRLNTKCSLETWTKIAQMAKLGLGPNKQMQMLNECTTLLIILPVEFCPNQVFQCGFRLNM